MSSARAVAVVSSCALVAACSGFEPIHPADDEQFMYKVNDRSVVQAIDSTTVRPMPLPRLHPGSKQAQAIPPKPVPSGTMLRIGAASALGFPPKGQVQLSNLSASPYSSAGRFDFQMPDGGYLCTAQAIGPDGVLLTAAHCVMEQESRSWFSSAQFKLRYNNGSYASASDWQCVAIFSGWVNGVYAYDYAFVKLRGVPTPGVGLTANVGPAEVDAIGYPVNYYNNRQLVDVADDKDGANPNAMPNPLSHGASGGGWYDSSGTAVSLNSFKYDNDESHMYGPAFTPSTIRLYDFVRSGCTSTHRMLGSNSLLLDKRFKSSTAALAVSPTVEIIDTGLKLTSSTTPGRCPLSGGQEFVLLNETPNRRLAAIARVSTSVDGSRDTGTDFVEVPAHGGTSLGCAISSSQETGTRVDLSNTYQILYEHRETSAPKPPNPASDPLLALITSDLKDCIPKCNAHDTTVCLDLGIGAISILAPLASFLDQTQSQATAPNGTVVKKSDIVAGFGGDPAKVDDPCYRGDVTKQDGQAVNEGLSCVAKANNPYAGDKAFAVMLHMPSTVRALPSSWSPTLVKDVGSSSTYFQNAVVAPVIEFSGKYADADNAQSGGRVHAVAALSPKQLVVSTDNGCVQGYFKR